MLKISRITLAILVIALSGYNLITRNFELMPYLILFLGAFMLVTGLAELQKGNTFWGTMSIIASLFVLFVSIQGFLLN